MTAQKMQKRLFGTNGVRGIAGKDMTPELVFSIGRALGQMRKGHIAVGRDTRTSGETLCNALKAGLLATGCDVDDCGILPTPALQFLVRDGYAGGAMITASHNPPEYNGVKIIEPDGTEMGDEETVRLEERIFSPEPSVASWEQVGKETAVPHLLDRYINGIIRKFPGSPGKGMTVVVDPGSGPACITTPAILEGLGCRVLTVNGVMDGTFPGRLPEPSVEGLKNLADLVVSSGASFGVAHDGDADRAVFVDENGQFVEENAEFALVVHHICQKKKGLIVTPVSSGQVVEETARRGGSTVRYTPVGSIYVARTMRTLIGNGEPVIFGGEGNGGPPVLPGRGHDRGHDGLSPCRLKEKIIRTCQPAARAPYHQGQDRRQQDRPDRWCENFHKRCLGARTGIGNRTDHKDYYRCKKPFCRFRII